MRGFWKWFAWEKNIGAIQAAATKVLILDTDHLSEFEVGSSAGERLRERLLSSGEDVATTIISAEEQLRGWLAQIHRLHDAPTGRSRFTDGCSVASSFSHSGSF